MRIKDTYQWTPAFISIWRGGNGWAGCSTASEGKGPHAAERDAGALSVLSRYVVQAIYFSAISL